MDRRDPDSRHAENSASGTAIRIRMITANRCANGILFAQPRRLWNSLYMSVSIRCKMEIAAKTVDALTDRVLARIPGHYTATTQFGAKFLNCSFADFLTRRLILFGIWEPSLTAFFTRRLTPGDVFVDVVSNIGYYSLLASVLVGRAGRVLAFRRRSIVT